jgi:hypothetical protein
VLSEHGSAGAERPNDLGTGAGGDERRVVAGLDRERVDRERVGARRTIDHVALGVLGLLEPQRVPGDHHDPVERVDPLDRGSEPRQLEAAGDPRDVVGGTDVVIAGGGRAAGRRPDRRRVGRTPHEERRGADEHDQREGDGAAEPVHGGCRHDVQATAGQARIREPAGS